MINGKIMLIWKTLGGLCSLSLNLCFLGSLLKEESGNSVCCIYKKKPLSFQTTCASKTTESLHKPLLAKSFLLMAKLNNLLSTMQITHIRHTGHTHSSIYMRGNSLQLHRKLFIESRCIAALESLLTRTGLNRWCYIQIQIYTYAYTNVLTKKAWGLWKHTELADHAVCKRQQQRRRHYTFRFSCLRGVSRERLRLEFKANIEVFG